MALFSMFYPQSVYHCIIALVGLQVLRVICEPHINLLSGVASNSFTVLDSSNFEPFIDKKPKFGFRL